MGALDLIFSDETRASINSAARRIRRRVDREEFRTEVERELWDALPFDRSEIRAIIDRVARNYEEC